MTNKSPSTIQMIENRKHPSRQCEVCGLSSEKFSRYCYTHTWRNNQYGHPTAKYLTWKSDLNQPFRISKRLLENSPDSLATFKSWLLGHLERVGTSHSLQHSLRGKTPGELTDLFLTRVALCEESGRFPWLKATAMIVSVLALEEYSWERMGRSDIFVRTELARMLFKAMPTQTTLKWQRRDGQLTLREFKNLPITMRRHLGQMIYENSASLQAIANKTVQTLERQSVMKHEREQSGMTRADRRIHKQQMKGIYLSIPDINDFREGADITVLDRRTHEKTRYRKSRNPMFKTHCWSVI